MKVIQRGDVRYYDVGSESAPELVPSVTSILGHVYRKIEWRWTEDDWRMQRWRELYRDRGQAIHSACYLLADGQGVKKASLDPMIVGHVDQFVDFLKVNRVETVWAEKYVRSRRYGFAGRLDLDIWVGSSRARRRRWVTDIKSGAPDSLVGPQTAAYWHAEVESEGLGQDEAPPGRAVLYLRPDSWDFVPLKNQPQDFAHFRKALETFKSAAKLGVLDDWSNPGLDYYRVRASVDTIVGEII